MMYHRNSKLPHRIFFLKYLFLYYMVATISTIALSVAICLIRGLDRRDISDCIILILELSPLLLAFCAKLVPSKVVDYIDKIEIKNDIDNSTISITYIPHHSSKEKTITFSLSDPKFKYYSYCNKGLEVYLINLLFGSSLSSPIGYCIAFGYFNEKKDVNKFDEIILQPVCGWDEKQLDEIIAELGKFKKGEEYYYGAKPKRKPRSTKI